MARLARRPRNWLVRKAGPLLGRGLRALPFGDRAETFLLQRIWSHQSAAMLDVYLVSGYQNPRINVQSILVRHALVRRLFGSEFDAVMDDEIRFAIELNETIRRRAAELGVTMGAYLDPAKHADVARVDAAIADRETEFQARWIELLDGRRAEPLEVLEFACGSANDYRAFVDYGLGPYLQYQGVDLTAKNIENARRRFPGVRFEVADILHLPYPDGVVDYVIASDIFEHLSVEGMERALTEAARLSRRGVILTFFNMSESEDHDVQQRGVYHWNRLSRPRVEAILRRGFSKLEVTPVADWLREAYSYPSSYNTHAYTIVAER